MWRGCRLVLCDKIRASEIGSKHIMPMKPREAYGRIGMDRAEKSTILTGGKNMVQDCKVVDIGVERVVS